LLDAHHWLDEIDLAQDTARAQQEEKSKGVA
jgi:hypothetical protein